MTKTKTITDNKQRLENIQRSIRVGDYINACNGYSNTWLQIIDIKPIDKPIPDRQNVKLVISTRSIDRDMCNTDRIFFISDILQFAIIQYDS